MTMNEHIIVTAADMALLGLLRSDASLRRELERAVVVSSAAVPPDVVTMHSTVTYRDGKDRATRTVTLVYPPEALKVEGNVSVLAPVGMALLGLSEGQFIDWEFPDGTQRRLEVQAVVRQPERLRHPPLPMAP